MKAFDPLDHNILLNKIKYLGFTPKTIDWFGSNLKRQNVVVSLKKTLSEIGIVNFGVPQGSILGLILFLSNRNDMKKSLKNCDLRIFAYNTCILCSHQNVEFIKRNLIDDLNNLSDKKNILSKSGNKPNLLLTITKWKHYKTGVSGRIQRLLIKWKKGRGSYGWDGFRKGWHKKSISS